MFYMPPEEACGGRWTNVRVRGGLLTLLSLLGLLGLLTLLG